MLVIKEMILPHKSYKEQYECAINALCLGKPVIFPTDTVYGLGVSVKHAKSPDSLFSLKMRDGSKSIAWLVDSTTALAKYGKNISDYAFMLAKKYWPGALTLVVEASNNVPETYLMNKSTIGLRMPANDVALALIRGASSPIAATSANISGCNTSTAFEDIPKSIINNAGAAIYDNTHTATEYACGIASTVVDCTGNTPKVLRQGSIKIDIY